MESSDKQIRVYKTSKKVFFQPLIIGGPIVIFFSIILESIIAVIFWLVFILIVAVIGLLMSTFKFIIDSDKQIVTVEKINFLGNVIETKIYSMIRYHFEIREKKTYHGRRRYYCFSFRDTNYKGGELYYNEDFYTHDYRTDGFSKKTVKLIENDIQKIQDKKV